MSPAYLLIAAVVGLAAVVAADAGRELCAVTIIAVGIAIILAIGAPT